MNAFIIEQRTIKNNFLIRMKKQLSSRLFIYKFFLRMRKYADVNKYQYYSYND